MNHFEKKNNILELKIEKKVDFLLENLSYEDDNLLSNHRNVHTPVYLHEFVFLCFYSLKNQATLQINQCVLDVFIPWITQKSLIEQI